MNKETLDSLFALFTATEFKNILTLASETKKASIHIGTFNHN